MCLSVKIQYVVVQLLSGVPRKIAPQAPLSMEFSRQEYWSGLPFPSPEDLPRPGIETMSFALVGGFFTTEPPGKPKTLIIQWQKLREMPLCHCRQQH